MQDKRYVFPLLVFIVAGMAFTAVLWATRWGVGTSPDSIAYISAARNLWAKNAAADPAALVFRPPFYPFILAIIGQFGVDPLLSARWLNAFLYAANVMLVGWVTWRCLPQTPWLGPIGALLVALALPLQEVHAYAWTEPAFICLGFTGFYALSLFLQQERKRWLWLTAVLFALTLLTRYAGLAFIMAGGLGLLVFSTRKWGQRLGNALLLGVIACLPLALWMVRNLGQGSSATGRAFVFHPANRTHFWQAVFTLTDWLYLPGGTPGIWRALVLAIVGFTAVILLFFALRHRGDESRPQLHAFFRLLLLFVPTYFLFLLFSISFLDAATPLDGRILSPMYVAGVFLAMALLAEGLSYSHRRHLAQGIAGILLTLFLVMAFVRSGRWLSTAHDQGLGFTSAAWQQAEIITAVKALPQDTLIFSNSPDAVYLLTNRPASPLPKKVEATTQIINENYAADLATMGDRLRMEAGVVVYFSALGRSTAVPGPQELGVALGLYPVTEAAEGVIYAPDSGAESDQ